MRIFILIGVVYSAMAFSAVPRPQKANYIPGGEPSDIARYPFISSMQLGFSENGFHHFCGGALLTSQTILSSANCYFGFSNLQHNWRVRLGSEYWNEGGSLHFVSEFILHKDFDAYSMDNNIAIVRLTVPATFSDKIGVARIAANNYNVSDDTLVDIVGWVQQLYVDPFTQDPDHLNENRKMRVINNEFCAARWLELSTTPGFTYYANVTDSMLCTGVYDDNDVRNTCVSNDGGPVIQYGDIVVGVYSWDYDCGYSNYPGVSAKVSVFSDWIVAQGSTRSDKISVA